MLPRWNELVFKAREHESWCFDGLCPGGCWPSVEEPDPWDTKTSGHCPNHCPHAGEWIAKHHAGYLIFLKARGNRHSYSCTQRPTKEHGWHLRPLHGIVYQTNSIIQDVRLSAPALVRHVPWVTEGQNLQTALISCSRQQRNSNVDSVPCHHVVATKKDCRPRCIMLELCWIPKIILAHVRAAVSHHGPAAVLSSEIELHAAF
mmetsp:Transcript_6063/g.11598  ORF Transcript_6063/g.11598 Transcript_6063/m.11598 type:complete len:203 (+) Transcript_6063:237-845(+)